MAQIKLVVAAMMVVGALAFSSLPTKAQDRGSVDDDVFSVNYFGRAHIPKFPDGTVRIVNPTGGLRCASIYVFNVNSKLEECCNCIIGNNALATFSVNALTGSPLDGVTLHDGVIKILSTLTTINGIPCHPTPDNVIKRARPAVRAWITHVQPFTTQPTTLSDKFSGETEAEFARSPLLSSPEEQDEIEATVGACVSIEKLNSTGKTSRGTCGCTAGP